MGAGRPAVGVPTLETLAAGGAGTRGFSGRIVAPVLDARHSEVFTALYLIMPPDPEGGIALPRPLSGILALGPEVFYRELLDILGRLRETGGTDLLSGVSGTGPRDGSDAVPARPASALEPAALDPDSLSGPCLILGPGADLLPVPPEGFVRGPSEGPDAGILADLGLLRLTLEGAALNPTLPLYGRSPEIFKTWTPPVRLPARKALEAT
jgi:hypothetical protein